MFEKKETWKNDTQWKYDAEIFMRVKLWNVFIEKKTMQSISSDI